MTDELTQQEIEAYLELTDAYRDGDALVIAVPRLARRVLSLQKIVSEIESLYLDDYTAAYDLVADLRAILSTHKEAPSD